MDRDLISLPLRLGFKATALAARLAWEGTQRIAGLVHSSDEAGWEPPAVHDVDPEPLIVDAAEQSPAHTTGEDGSSRETPRTAPLAAAEQPQAAEPEPEPEPEPEVELVAEVADPGAEDGVGAQIDVAAPWDGYDRLTAADVADRLTAASPAELGVVALYERANRRRETVLRAVERQLAETT